MWRGENQIIILSSFLGQRQDLCDTDNRCVHLICARQTSPRLLFLQQLLILPFLGYNIQKVSLNSRLKATIYDFGGGNKITPCFRFFYPGCRGIVFIIPRFWATYYHEWLSDLKKDEKPKEVAIT